MFNISPTIIITRTNLLEKERCEGNPTSVYCTRETSSGYFVEDKPASRKLQEICKTCPTFAQVIEAATRQLGHRIQAEKITQRKT